MNSTLDLLNLNCKTTPLYMGELLDDPIAHISNKKIKLFQKQLLNWYEKNGRHFHWRKKNLTQYQYIIAEVLLQRTKAETVAKFYSKFIIDFPNWRSLSIANLETLENYLKPLGLYRQRSRRLILLAKEMEKRKGKLPRNRKELETIPFFGQYIANAIELIIHKFPVPLIDVNMSRLLERFFGERKMVDIRFDPYLQKLAYKVVNHEKALLINWAILDFATLVCRAQLPKCNYCIFKQNCKYVTS